jgi:hypothetical protein
MNFLLDLDYLHFILIFFISGLKILIFKFLIFFSDCCNLSFNISFSWVRYIFRFFIYCSHDNYLFSISPISYCFISIRIITQSIIFFTSNSFPIQLWITWSWLIFLIPEFWFSHIQILFSLSLSKIKALEQF